MNGRAASGTATAKDPKRAQKQDKDMLKGYSNIKTVLEDMEYDFREIYNSEIEARTG